MAKMDRRKVPKIKARAKLNLLPRTKMIFIDY
jgi:ribosomal protein S30